MNLLVVVVNYKATEMTLATTEFAVRVLDNLADDWQVSDVDNEPRDGSFQIIKKALSSSRNPGWEKVKVAIVGSYIQGPNDIAYADKKEQEMQKRITHPRFID